MIPILFECDIENFSSYGIGTLKDTISCEVVEERNGEFECSLKYPVSAALYHEIQNQRIIKAKANETSNNLIDDINSTKDSVTEVNKEVAKLPTFISSAIEKSSSFITGQSGGYVVLNGDENAQPYEILILDKPSIDSAVNVWRWNSGGLGFSNNGYNGPYETAMTADGQIVADFIASGTLYANLIKAGVISSVDGSSYWDLESGEVNFSAYAKKDSLDNKSTIFTEVPSAYIVNDTLILFKTIVGLETQLKKGTMYISSANSSDNDNFTLCDSDNNKLLDSSSDSLFTYNVRFEDWYKSDDYITSEESNASMEIISNQILHEVSQKYTSNEDVVSLEKSILTQTSNSFDFRFNTITTDIDDVAKDVSSNQSTLEEYIRFEGATIKLGRSDSDWTIEIHNDRIEFKELGNVIAYMTGQKLHITEANFTDSVSIQGLNFTQEANGSFTINPE